MHTLVKECHQGSTAITLLANYNIFFPVGRCIETLVCQCHWQRGIANTAAWISQVHCVQCISAGAASATEGHFPKQKPLSDQCSL